MLASFRRIAACFAVVSACSDDGVPQGDGLDATSGGGTTSGVDVDTSVDASGGITSPSTADPSADATSNATSDPADTTGDTTAGPPTGGCGMPYAGEPVVEGQLDVDGTARTFVLSVPEGYDPSVPMPLVFAWHGLGGNGNLARLYFGVEDEASGAAIFVYPDALPMGSLGGQTGWELVEGGRDVAFFDALLAHLDSGLCIDHERLFSTGHSFGGYMSNALGCFRGDLLRAIAPVAGGPPIAGECTAGSVAAWIAHGTLDEVVPFSQGEQARDTWVAGNGCGASSAAVAPEPCVAYDGCDPDHGVVWCAHDIPDQSGHLWPPFAAAAIWEFFAGLQPASP
jgi:poly(3-hydroxybutyrate) depolymerase